MYLLEIILRDYEVLYKHTFYLSDIINSDSIR